MVVIVFFFMWKSYYDDMIDSLDTYDTWLDSTYFWGMILTSLFWFISFPTILLWVLLEYLYKLFNKTKNK
jgi:hypothetical protein